MVENSQELKANIDPTLTGKAMRDEQLRLYNQLVYFSEQHSYWEARKKKIDSILEVNKDIIRKEILDKLNSEGKKITSVDKEVTLDNIWNYSVNFEDKTMTMLELNNLLSDATSAEILHRHSMNTHEKGIEVARSSLSYDKVELSHLEGVK